MFGEVIANVTPRLALSLGGRIFYQTSTTQGYIASFASSGFPAAVGRQVQTGLAPQVLLSYRLVPGVITYLQVSEGYRPGGLNTFRAPSETLNVTAPQEPRAAFSGDELYNFEGGAKFSSWEGKLTARMGVFYATWRSMQSEELLPSGFSYVANIGDGANTGAEFESALKEGRLELRSHFLFNSPELTRSNAAFVSQPDLGLAAAPDRTFGLSGRYEWDLRHGRQLEFNAGWSFVGASHLPLGYGLQPKMGDYDSTRASLVLTGTGWKIDLSVENLGDSRGDTFSYGNPFTIRQQAQATPLRPRTISLSYQIHY